MKVILFLFLLLLMPQAEINQSETDYNLLIANSIKSHIAMETEKIEEDIIKEISLSPSLITKWVISEYQKENFEPLSENEINNISKHILNHSKYPAICASIFWVETKFRKNLVSHAGAKGLAQIMDVHHEELIKEKIINSGSDLFKPECAVIAFDYIFEKMLRLQDYDFEKTLRMYSGGNKKYTYKVMSALDSLYKFSSVEESAVEQITDES